MSVPRRGCNPFDDKVTCAAGEYAATHCDCETCSAGTYSAEGCRRVHAVRRRYVLKCIGWSRTTRERILSSWSARSCIAGPAERTQCCGGGDGSSQQTCTLCERARTRQQDKPTSARSAATKIAVTPRETAQLPARYVLRQMHAAPVDDGRSHRPVHRAAERRERRRARGRRRP